MDQQYLQNLHACLEQISAPTGGTEGIKNATKALNEQFYKSPNAVPGLFQVLSTSQNPSVRQLAAVELRKRVSVASHKHWKRLDVDTRQAIKSRLLELLVSDAEVRATRHSVARVVAEVAEVEVGNRQWPELLNFLVSASSAPSASQREVAIFTLYALMDTVVEVFSDQLPQIYGLFGKALTDPESLEVRVTTIQALGRVAEYIENDETSSIATYQSMVPAIVQVTGQTLDAADEPAAKKCFDTLESLLILETPLLNPHLGSFVQFLVGVGSNRRYDEALRIMGLNCLLWTIKFKKGKLAQMEMGKPIIDALIQIGAEDEPDDVDDDSVARTAFRCLDALATGLSPQAIFPALYERISECSRSPDPTLRKAAIMALGVTVEGCSMFIAPHLHQLWPFIDAGLQDSDVRVRKASCTALSCLCDVLGDETAKRHEVLVPILTPLLNDPETQRNAMTALDTLLEALDAKVIGLYLHPLMERLVPMLDQATLALKATVVGAIGSAAYAAKKAFIPYFEPTMQRITPFLSLKEEGEEQDLRGITQDTLGTLASAVGPDAFRPYLEASMAVAFEAIAMESPQLRECSMIFFGVLAKVYGEEFVPWLPKVMPAVLASLGQTDDVEDDAPDVNAKLTAAGKGFSVNDDEEAEEDFVDVDDVDLDSDSDELMKVTTAVALEKAVAADAVLDIFEHTKAAYVPFLDATVKSLVALMQHFYPGTRKAAATTLIGAIGVAAEIGGQTSENRPAGLAHCALTGQVKALVDLVVPEVLTVWESDDECDVVGEIALAFAQTLGTVGAGVVAPTHLERICTYLMSILERKALCQQDTDLADETEAATGELSEVESALVSNAEDFVGALATTLGADFASAFAQFMPQIARFAGPEFSPADRANALGALAECTTGLESAIGQYAPQILQLGLNGAADADVDVRSNAAFLLGSVVYFTEADMGGQYMAILERLLPMFSLSEGAELEKVWTAKDNAAGAVARLLLKNKAAVPVDQVLPVFFNALPLHTDFAEYPKCLDAVFQLFQEQGPHVQAASGHLLDVFTHIMKPAGEGEDAPITDEYRAKIVELLRVINNTAPEQISGRGLNAYL